MKNLRPIIIVTTVAFLLLIPLIAMQLTDEVNWTLSDFLVAAFLLLSTGFTVDYIIRKVKRPKHRIAVIMVVLILLILIWGELAVGIFGTPFGGQ